MFNSLCARAQVLAHHRQATRGPRLLQVRRLHKTSDTRHHIRLYTRRGSFRVPGLVPPIMIPGPIPGAPEPPCARPRAAPNSTLPPYTRLHTRRCDRSCTRALPASCRCAVYGVYPASYRAPAAAIALPSPPNSRYEAALSTARSADPAHVRTPMCAAHRTTPHLSAPRRSGRCYRAHGWTALPRSCAGPGPPTWILG